MQTRAKSGRYLASPPAAGQRATDSQGTPGTKCFVNDISVTGVHAQQVSVPFDLQKVGQNQWKHYSFWPWKNVSKLWPCHLIHPIWVTCVSSRAAPALVQLPEWQCHTLWAMNLLLNGLLTTPIMHHLCKCEGFVCNGSPPRGITIDGQRRGRLFPF